LYKAKSPLVVFAFLLAIAFTCNVDAERRGRGDRGGNAKVQQSLISQDRAAAVARSATGGRVLNIRLEGGGRPKYRVKMLLDGKRVRTISVDARSGAILK
jgi:uncharacterized membrane protein YkoI